MGETAAVGEMSCVAACVKWVDLRPEIDPLEAQILTDDRFCGLSAADEAALEMALRCGERWGLPVVVVTAGPNAADAVLRDALAVGASSVIRVDHQHAYDSSDVAADLAAALGPERPAVVWCGDWSFDRGSGSVPPMLAAGLGAAQACGLVDVTIGALPSDEAMHAVRRLDGGRRERLVVPAPAVVSVEGVVARLRRAPLRGVLAATRAEIDVRPTTRVGEAADAPVVLRVEPYRPRAKSHDGPTHADPRRRVELLTGALSQRTPPQRLTLNPAAAAAVILEQLRVWGEL